MSGVGCRVSGATEPVIEDWHLAPVLGVSGDWRTEGCPVSLICVGHSPVPSVATEPHHRGLAPSTGCRVSGVGCRVSGVGCRVSVTAIQWVWATGYRLRDIRTGPGRSEDEPWPVNLGSACSGVGTVGVWSGGSAMETSRALTTITCATRAVQPARTSPRVTGIGSRTGITAPRTQANWNRVSE